MISDSVFYDCVGGVVNRCGLYSENCYKSKSKHSRFICLPMIEIDLPLSLSACVYIHFEGYLVDIQNMHTFF